MSPLVEFLLQDEKTTSYQLRDSEAVAFNGGHDCGSETVLHIKPFETSVFHHRLSFFCICSFNLCRVICHTSPKCSQWLSAQRHQPLTPLSIEPQSEPIWSDHAVNSHMIIKQAANYPHQHASHHLWRGKQTNWFGFFFSVFLLLKQFSPTTYRASNQTTDQKAKTG